MNLKNIELITSYDYIVINSSAGKDSLAMMHFVAGLVDDASFPKQRVIVAHADLGDMEWSGTKELAEEQAKHFGFEFLTFTRVTKDGTPQSLLEQIEARGKWPSSAARYCTSDHKRGPIGRLFTQLSKRNKADRGCSFTKVLNCMGLRAQESKERAKRSELEANTKFTNKSRVVDNWHPILDWSVDKVWAWCNRTPELNHPAYSKGMTRLSCVFCVFAPKSALRIAGKHNPDLLDKYCEAETRMGHDFTSKFSINSIRDDLRLGDTRGNSDTSRPGAAQSNPTTNPVQA